MVKHFPYNIIDLTHMLSEETPTWDGECGFNHAIKQDYDDFDEGVKFRVQQVKMRAGIGTHIDAPSHCFEDAATVGAISLEDLIAPAICIDVSAKMAPDYKLSADEVIDFEKQYGEIPPGCFVVVYTGWSKYWNKPSQYHNNHCFPSVSADAAELLITREIVGLGIDTLSPDLPPSGFPVHKIVLGAGKYIVENVANADKLPKTGSYVLTMPIKAEDLVESPVRMIGLIEK